MPSVIGDDSHWGLSGSMYGIDGAVDFGGPIARVESECGFSSARDGWAERAELLARLGSDLLLATTLKLARATAVTQGEWNSLAESDSGRHATHTERGHTRLLPVS